MWLLVFVQDQALITLIDSGSTHCFMAAHVARRLNLTPTAKDGMIVGLANGERLPYLGVRSALPFAINIELFCIDFLGIALEGYEMVLGCNWLRTLRAIIWDFSRLSMAFWWLDHRVKWTGLGATRSQAFAISTDNHLQLLLAKLVDVFAEPSGLPPPRPFDHHIHLLPSTPPVAGRPYRYPQPLKDEIEKQCDDMIRQGIIRPSTSPISALILLVRKKDHTWRFCVDYRALNTKTVKDKFPISVVNELLDEHKGARYFTKLDLRSDYHQVLMHPNDIAKTAFQTHHGHFEFLVMAIGLTNAPSTFQALMNDVLHAYLRRFVLVFFYDILIYSTAWAEHLQHVRLVLVLARCQAEQVLLRYVVYLLPQPHHLRRWRGHGPSQGRGDVGLATPHDCQGTTRLPRPRRLLP
jgi:hypothetical protein